MTRPRPPAGDRPTTAQRRGWVRADRRGDDQPDAFDRVEADGSTYLRYPAGTGGILDLRGRRRGRAVDQDPNTNVLHPRTVVPTLTGTYDPGVHWLVSAVTAATADGEDAWERPPSLVTDGAVATIEDASGVEILRCDADAPGPLESFVPE